MDAPVVILQKPPLKNIGDSFIPDGIHSKNKTINSETFGIGNYTVCYCFLSFHCVALEEMGVKFPVCVMLWQSKE